MRKVVTLILILTLFQLSETVAQERNMGLMVSMGGATFRMDDMKYLQEYILGTYPVEGKIISSFPPYTAASINILKQWLPMVRIGGGYAFTSTGGKSDYTDYSGNIHTNIIAASHRLGAFVSYTILGSDRLDFLLYGRLDANFTKIEASSSIYAAGLSNILLSTYRSLSPQGSTGLELMYNLKDFSFGMDGGYLVDFPGGLNDKGSGIMLYDPADAQRVLTSDWSGWRVSIKAIFWLGI